MLQKLTKMSHREILTIQLGHYSNFVGTHWWNIQESNFSYDPENPSEVDPDVLYREGSHQKKVTFTPRLLIADLKGTFGYLSQEGNLSEIFQEENQAPEVLWEENKLEITEEPTATKSSFIQNLEKSGNADEIKYDLEKETNTWVDYLVPRFHPRSVNIITDYQHGSATQPFDTYPLGVNLWKSQLFSEDFIDRIRAYVEECNMMQGFQVLVDSDDGFSGLGASCIEYLHDEYGKSILTWPIVDATPRDPSMSDYMKVINTVLCWHKLGESSSLFSPLCCGKDGWLTPGKARVFNDITYRSDLKYHTSALLATALDTLSLRYRHKKYSMATLSDLCSDLNKVGRKAVATSLSLPFPMIANTDLIDVLDDLDGSCPWTSLTPSCTIDTNNILQSLSLRGIPEDRLKRPAEDARDQMNKSAYRCSSVHEMMSLYLDCSSYASGTYLTTVEQPLKIQDPYPKIFNSNVTRDGNILGGSRKGNEDVKSVPVLAGLQSGKFIANMYESLHNHAKKIRSIKKFHVYKDAGLEEDDYLESVNNLLECKENYEDHYV